LTVERMSTREDFYAISDMEQGLKTDLSESSIGLERGMMIA